VRRLPHPTTGVGTEQFRSLRRAWLLAGNRPNDVAMSRSLTESIARGGGGLTCQELSPRYLHFAPLGALLEGSTGEQEGEQLAAEGVPPLVAARRTIAPQPVLNGSRFESPWKCMNV
jgi:hypothetical protein